MEKMQTESFRKRLLKLVLPIAFQQFMLSLVSASDAFMLSKLSQDALSAVSLATQITFVQNLFLAAMTIGFSTLASQYWGKGDRKSLEKIFSYVLKITLGISLLFFLFGLFTPKLLMKIFTNDQLLIEKGAIYLKTVSPSYLLSGASQIYLCALKNSSKAPKSSLISSFSVVLNIILNALLIFGLFSFPRMEIAGAALATVISKTVECLWCIIETAKKDSVKIRKEYILKLDEFLFKDFWKYTLPVLGNEIVWGVGFTMYSVIMGHLGNDAVAASSIANIIKNLVACFFIGLASGGGIMIGNLLGSGNLEKAKEDGRRLCHLSIIFGAASGAVILVTIPLILKLSPLTPLSKDYLKKMLLICCYYTVARSVNCTTISGIFCAGGDTKFGFFCDVFTMWGVCVPLGFICAFWLKLPVIGVYFVICLDELVKLFPVYKHYIKYKWVKDLTV